MVPGLAMHPLSKISQHAQAYVLLEAWPLALKVGLQYSILFRAITAARLGSLRLQLC
jgi:hypothetical protein